MSCEFDQTMSNVRQYLAQCEDNVLVIFADIVHAGVVPGSNVVLWDVSVRGVTLVVPLVKNVMTVVTLGA